MSQYIFTSKSHFKQQVRKSAVAFYMAGSIAFCLFIFLLYWVDRELEAHSYEEANLKTVYSSSVEVSGYFFEAIADLQSLSKNSSVFNHDFESRAKLAYIFLEYARIQRNYHQLRFIDLKGMEVVRVDYVDGIAYNVPRDRLQDKSQRDYFKRSISLEKGEVYISKFDLNIERHEIEIPIRPVVRLAMTVYEPGGKKAGIIIINYLGEHLLANFTKIDEKTPGRLMLLNSDGYWLYSDNESDNWGFMFSHNRKFQDDYPDAWNRIANNTEGQVKTRDGLFTFKTSGLQEGNFYDWLNKLPPGTIASVHPTEKPWKIVSYIDSKTLSAQTNSIGKWMLAALAPILVVLIPVSVYWGRLRAQSVLDKKRINTFAKIIEQSNDLIYVTDRSSNIIYANPSFEKYTGYPISEAIGQKPNIVNSGRHSKKFYTQMYNRINQGKDFQGVLINRKKDGSIFYETKTIHSLKDDHGVIEYFVSVGRDITSTQKEKERELENATLMSAAISHHFNNILNVIINYTKLAMRELAGSTQEKPLRYLNSVSSVAKQAEDLVDKIYYSGQQELTELSLIPGHVIIQESINKISGEIPDKFKLKTRFEKDLPYVKMKGNLIDYALRALIFNSVEAINKAGRSAKESKIDIIVNVSPYVKDSCVTCQTPLSGNYYTITVIDNGCGIQKADRSRVFDPFFTKIDSSNSIIKTPGLGLTAVRGIMHAHRGHILLKSVNNKGTTITLLLPLDS